jgi:hypothetical protein
LAAEKQVSRDFICALLVVVASFWRKEIIVKSNG